MASQDRFGYEWNRYASMYPLYEQQFRNWTGMEPADFVDKDVLDAGCGMGRNSYWPAFWGAKSVTAFDFDKRSVAAAQETLKEFSNVTVLYKNIFEIDWQTRFDIAFSIGVIHHLEDPKLALARMTNALRPNGKLLIWVYSREGNEIKVPIINAMRFFTSWLPLPLVHALSYIPSSLLYLFVQMPTRNAYFLQLRSFDYWHVHSIVFDQLIPTIAHYWTKDEVAALVEGLPLHEITVTRPKNDMGWTLTALKN